MNRLIVITGPTATGKSKFSIYAAKKLGGEIISADSMQIYKYMNIGTAKPTPEEKQLIPHHMIDIISPLEDYSVAQYISDASCCIDDITSRGKVPIITGGTGLYIDSLLSGRYFSNRGDPELRKSLENEFDNTGGDKMLKKLFNVDPDSATRLHGNDKKRIVRALEIFETTGKTITEHDIETKKIPPKYDFIKLALMFSSRADLYKRIDSRVDDMLKSGLLDEVQGLLDMGVSRKKTSMQAIGYKEIIDKTFSGCDNLKTLSDEDLINISEKIKMGSRRYAKRQLTWLRRDASVKWIIWENEPDFDFSLKVLESYYEKK